MRASSAPPTDPQHLELTVPTGVVPLGYVREGSELYLIGRDRGARWPTQILRTGVARL